MSTEDARAEEFPATDRFTIQRRLGSGGMGVVYQALDHARSEVIALKTLRELDAAAMVRFKHEFRAMADVSHPNLVSLYELISVGEQLFFTMELVVGRSFLRWVRHQPDEAADDATQPLSEERLPSAADLTAPQRRLIGVAPSSPPSSPLVAAPVPRSAAPLPASGRLDATRLRSALRQLAEGVAAIHAAGMVHRDLKPSNVLVTQAGRVKVLDFGLVTELSRERVARVEQSLAGTAAYMAPEQGARLPLSPATDWYAVGVMLYQALTGRLPFLGSSTDVLVDKQRFEPPAPCELASGVPQDLNALCVELLRRDPLARPIARDVLRRLGSETAVIELSSSGSTQGPSSFIGRERQMTALHEAFAAARGGRAVVQFVHGTSGMGKSALVRRFLDDVEAHGAVVLTGRCYERESVPYKALDSLIDALSHHLANLPRLEAEAVMPRDIAALARIFPALRQVEAVTAAPRRTFESPDPIELRRRAFNALREMLARLADRKPLVIAIDDLQWGDVDSAAVVAAVLRPPDSPSVMWVGSCRAEDRETSPFLRELRGQLDLHAGDFREISVGPLSQLEARDLALALIGADDEPARAQAEHIAREAGGNPFFIGELARHVREGEEKAPELLSLGDVLHARLRRLPPDARRLLDTLAVAGRPILRSVALRAAEVRDATALAVLKAANLARTSGGEDMIVECYHDRIREAAFGQLGADEVRFVHRRLGIAIEASARPDNEALAIHFREAGERERAAEFAIQAAARAASSLAFDRAAWLYRFALELDPPESVAQTLRVRLGDALANAGRGAEAGEAYLAAAAKSPAGEALELKRRAAAQLLFCGHLAAGKEVLANVLGELGMKLAPTPARALSSLLWQRARIRLRGLRYRERSEGQLTAVELMRIDVASAVSSGLGMVDSIRAADFQARQLLLALDAGEPRRLVRALAAEAGFVSMGGVRAAARSARVLAELDALARHVGTPEALGLRAGGRGMVAFQEGRWRDALAESTEAEQIFRDRCTGFAWEQNLTQIFAAFALALLGRIRELSEQVARLIKEARERGDLYTEANLQCAVGYYGALAADKPELARAQIAEGLARWNIPDAVQLPHFNAVMSEIVIDLYANDPVRAWERLAERHKSFERAQLLRAQPLRISVLYSRTRAAVGRAVAGERGYLRHALADARALEREGVGYAAAQAALTRAEVALIKGEERAAALLDEAERRYAACDQALYAAAVRWIRGKLVGGDEGAKLVTRSEDFCVAEGIRHPMRMFSTLAPTALLFDPARPQPPAGPLRGRGMP